MKILVVDDEPQIATMVSDFLRAKGLRVEIAHNGEAALSKFREDPEGFLMVISDVRLPDIDGLSLYTRIMQKKKGLPFIFMTGNLDQESSIASLGKSGGIELLLKPFSLFELYRLIMKYLEPSS